MTAVRAAQPMLQLEQEEQSLHRVSAPPHKTMRRRPMRVSLSDGGCAGFRGGLIGRTRSR
jgi:hypothetical protein